jgi:hypothetical protein
MWSQASGGSQLFFAACARAAALARLIGRQVRWLGVPEPFVHLSDELCCPSCD